MRSSACKRYPFRGESGEVVWVDFETMMGACGPFLELDGETYKRAYDLEIELNRKEKEKLIPRASGLSDSMGFTKKALAERVEHLKQTGIKGIEFKEDPQVPGFYQVQYDSEKARNKYAKKLGLRDQNSRNGSGAMLSEEQMNKARDLVLRVR
jgi:hypothetical protein